MCDVEWRISENYTWLFEYKVDLGEVYGCRGRKVFGRLLVLVCFDGVG